MATIWITKKIRSLIQLQKTALWQTNSFIYASIVLFLLFGLVIPGSLIASSVQEFSFIESYTSPFPFIFRTLLQSAGIFIFWPFCLYFLFPKNTKILLTAFMVFICAFSLVNTFLFAENFGFLTINLLFSDPKPFSMNYKISGLNILLLLPVAVLFLWMLFSKKKSILLTFQIILLISLGTFGISNILKIQNEFSRLRMDRQMAQDVQTLEPVYTFSKKNKNVLFIMLDRGMPGFLPDIFKEKPELSSDFTGFTWYPNAVSFGGHTLIAAPPLYGGYEYTPLEINKRETELLFEKHKQAYLVLPRLFSDSGYAVTVTDPTFDNYQANNLSIFTDYPQIHAENIIGKHTSTWLKNHSDVTGLSITNLLKNNLIRFSFFKTSPLAFRSFIYDSGDWLVTQNLKNLKKAEGALTLNTINYYAHMDLLPELTRIEDDAPDTFTEMYTMLAHDSCFLQTPDYIPASNITDKGSGPFADNSSYHVNMASYLLLAEWFNFLKQNGVYDNTRIIIVSDHGGGSGTDYPGNIILPNGQYLQDYHILLLFKDFNTDGENFTIDNSFMTNADAPFLAFNNIIDNPKNRFTGRPLYTDKKNGITLSTVGVKSSSQHGKYQYSIGKNQWLHVHDNIFNTNNWEKGKND
jgi:hypothetical protein